MNNCIGKLIFPNYLVLLCYKFVVVLASILCVCINNLQNYITTDESGGGEVENYSKIYSLTFSEYRNFAKCKVLKEMFKVIYFFIIKKLFLFYIQTISNCLIYPQ